MSAKTTIQETFDLSTLPPIPKSWKWCVPADCCSVIASGSTPKPDLMYSETGDVPFIKVYNLTHRGVLDFSVKPTFIDLATHIGPMSRSRAMPNDVLINIVGPPLGKVAIVPDDHPQWNINQAVVLFRPLDGVLSKYLAYAFLTDSIMKRVTSLAKATAGQSNIGVSMCRRLLPLPIAPTNEQHRIVAKIEELFSDLDAGVAALKRAKANLKRYRAAVLKAAVEGKLTEEWRAKHPAKESASTLLARILQERRQKWEADQLAKFAAAGKEPPKNWREKYVEPTRPDTAGLPELPKGWCWASVEQLAFVDVGFAFKSAEYTKKGIRLLRGENMEPGSLRWNDVRFWPEDKLAGLEHLLVEEGQIILAMDRPMVSAGLKLARVKANDIPCLLVQRMARLRMLDDTMTGFLYGAMQTHAFISHLLGDQTGTQLPHISGSGIEEFVMPLPPHMEQQLIAAEVAETLSQIEATVNAIDHDLLRASRLRQSILKQAFEGKLVPQDPNDEPASVLLEQIRAKQAIHEGHGKRPSSDTPHRSKPRGKKS